MIANKRSAYRYVFVFAKACPYLPALITIVKNSWQLDATKLAQAGLCPPYCWLYFEKKTSSFGNNVFLLQTGTRNKTVLNDQFENSVFHLQIGTRNKTVLNDQFGNNVFHLQIGTRNKTVLICQFGNNVFRALIGTRNKTVLIYQFRNNVFHLQLGTRNEMFPFYTRVNVLFLSCKKSGPLIVNRNTKTRNSQY